MQLVLGEDEMILDIKTGWDYVIPVVGKFEDIAIQLDYLARGLTRRNRYCILI